VGPQWTVELLHAPGHTPGHLIIWDTKNQAAFMGEAALGYGLCSNEGQYFSPPPYYDSEAYLSTLDMLVALEPQYLFNTHFGIMEGEAAARFLWESRDYVERAEKAITDILAEAGDDGLTLKELCVALDPVLGPYDSAEELGPVVTGHLKGKLETGKVKLGGKPGTPPRYRAN
jgi:glyoxylase-like metal-dependent hydrolase (beta-lactamase superfamily II)